MHAVEDAIEVGQPVDGAAKAAGDNLTVEEASRDHHQHDDDLWKLHHRHFISRPLRREIDKTQKNMTVSHHRTEDSYDKNPMRNSAQKCKPAQLNNSKINLIKNFLCN